MATVCSVVLPVNTQINKIAYKTDKNRNIFVILLILFVNSMLKQQSTQLPAIKAMISQEIF
jgi:hypothetical protein